jgi:hypothetical protein
MIQTTVGSARTWIMTTIQTRASIRRDEYFVYVLGRFREHYLSPQQASVWRKQLTTRLNTHSDRHLTLTELETHYGNYVRTLNNLRVCEREVTEADAISYYVDTLPQFIYQFLGAGYKNYRTLEDVHRAACYAIRPADLFHPRPRDVAAAAKRAVTEVNAAETVHSTTASGHTNTPDRLYDKQQQRRAQCFHCGDNGHYLSDCPFYKANKPQTAKGKEAWARRQQLNGTNFPYDPAKLLAAIEAKKKLFAHQQAGGGGDGQKQRHRRLVRFADEDDDDDVSSSSAPANKQQQQKPAHQQRAQHHSMNVIEICDDDDGEWDDTGEKQVFECKSLSLDASVSDEKRTASSLCVAVEMNGVCVGSALVDQGANRSLIRKSAFDRHHLHEHVALHPVRNYYVATASNHLVPIVGRFMTKLTVDGDEFNDSSVVYVVNDTDELDISCDVVLGRNTIARSRYRLIDTLAARLLSHTDPHDYIQCSPCKPCKRKDGKHDIVATSTTSARAHAHADHTQHDVAELVVSVAASVVSAEQAERRPSQSSKHNSSCIIC